MGALSPTESPIEQLLDDLKVSLRSIYKRRSQSLLIVFTLACGIACTTAMYSVVAAVLLEPLPWPESQQIAVIRNQPPQSADPIGFSRQEITDLETLLPEASLGTYQKEFAQVSFSPGSTGGIKRVEDATSARDALAGEPENLSVTYATKGLFSVLGCEPVLGRGFTPEEHVFGGPRAAIPSYEVWQRLFQGREDVLGATVQVDNFSYEVVGVFPEDCPLPWDYTSGEKTDVWVAAHFDYAQEWPRETRVFTVLTRLPAHVDIDQLQTNLDAAMATFRERHRELYPEGWTMVAASVEEQILEPARSPMLALFGAVLFVLLIACTNVANLLLAQHDERKGSIAMRLALGASRSRLIRQLLTESLVLALIGGALGILGAYGLVHSLPKLQSSALPRMDSVSLDGGVLAFGLAATVFTAFLFGVLPSLRLVGGHLPTSLGRARGATSGEGKHLRRSLVIAQIALATILVAGAGLLIRTLTNLADADLGFEARGLQFAAIRSPMRPGMEGQPLERFWDSVLARVLEEPGVDSAAMTMAIPLNSGVMSRALEIESSSGVQSLPRVTLERASARIAETMGYNLLQGRDLSPQDDVDAVPAVLVNRTLAQHLEDASGGSGQVGLGARVRLAESDGAWMTVVGIVDDVVFEAVGAPIAPRIIIPYAQNSKTGVRTQPVMWLAIRSSSSFSTAQRTDFEAPSATSIRTMIADVDPGAFVLESASMSEYVEQSDFARYRFAAFVLSVFAAVSLALASIGIYGMLAFLVNSTTREVGLRMALGASTQQVQRLVQRNALFLAIAGLLIGIPAGLALSRWLESLLFDVSPTEPVVFLITALVLLFVALAAALIPAQRAIRVDPAEVLRSDG